MPKIGRNSPCICGSGFKYKKCCGDPTKENAAHISARLPMSASSNVELRDSLLDALINATHKNEEALFEQALFAGLHKVPLQAFSQGNAALEEKMREFDPLQIAASFSGLLTMPDLQSNCLRIEALVHAGLAYGAGEKAVEFRDVNQWFSGLENSLYARLEDPAEDVFVSVVSNANGSFRIFEGTYESSSFYLQRIVNIVESMPDGESYATIKDGVLALLKLSEAIAERNNIDRYTQGSLTPIDIIADSIKYKIDSAKNSISFSKADLVFLNITEKSLEPFLFLLGDRASLGNEDVQNSRLERKPVILHNETYYVVLPTALSPAIRHFVISALTKENLIKNLELALVREYQALLESTLVFGKIRGIPFRASPVSSGYVASAMSEIDCGRYLQFIFFVDNFNGYEESGFSGVNTIENKSNFNFDKVISEAVKQALKQPDFKSGMTLIIGCGWGRGLSYTVERSPHSNWHIEHLSAPNMITLSWLHEFTPLTPFRMQTALQALTRNGVEIFNVNGFLNLYAYLKNNDFHLVSHGDMPAGFGGEAGASLLMIDPSELRKLRHEIFIHWDEHVLIDEEGKAVPVRKNAQSIFKEDLRQPLYISYTEIREGRLRAVYETKQRLWWLEVIDIDNKRGGDQVEYFKMLYVWLSRTVPVVEAYLPDLPVGVITWKVFYQLDDIAAPSEFSTDDRLRDLIRMKSDKDKKTITLTIKKEFEAGFATPKNVAERVIVEKFLSGVVQICGQDFDLERHQSLIAQIIKNEDARQRHGFYAQDFRDFIRNALSDTPILIDPIDHAALHIGMGWLSTEKIDEKLIVGKEECTKYLSSSVKALERVLCTEIQRYNKKHLISDLMINHETIAADRDTWRRTAKAIFALHSEKEETFDAFLSHDNKLNSAFLTSRALVEVAVCECPNSGGMRPGELDLSQLMALMLAIVQLGEWSDLIHFEYMEEKIKITSLGDIQANVDFSESVIRPYSYLGRKKQINAVIEKYEKNFFEPSYSHSVQEAFREEFLNAWQLEFGFTLDDMRAFVECLENFALEKEKAVLHLQKNEITNLTKEKLSSDVCEKIINGFALMPRHNWHDIPDGYNDSDRQPWRYRRRLSLLRRPLVQIDNKNDPTFIVAPGLLKEGFIYTVLNFSDGGFHQDHASTKAMKRWLGTIGSINGEDFNRRVNEKMESLGWQVKSGVKPTEIFGKSLDIDYGDIDVLAWNEKTGEVILMECKDLKFSKTSREIAEQLYKYRGVTDSKGKRDNLKKHLDRVDLIQKHPEEISKYLRLSVSAQVKGLLVFSNIVPMQFVWDRIQHDTEISIFEDLDELKVL